MSSVKDESVKDYEIKQETDKEKVLKQEINENKNFDKEGDIKDSHSVSILENILKIIAFFTSFLEIQFTMVAAYTLNIFCGLKGKIYVFLIAILTIYLRYIVIFPKKKISKMYYCILLSITIAYNLNVSFCGFILIMYHLRHIK